MKYKQALQEKGISLENLSKSLQNQIAKLEADNSKIEAAQSNELGEEGKALIDEAKKELQSIDDSISKKIMLFNPALQERRKQIMQDALKARQEKKQSPKPEPVKPVKTVKTEKVEEKPKNNVSVKEKIVEVQKEIEQTPIIQHKPKPTSIYEENEFDRVQVVKKKRNGLWFGLIGIGALAITWGAVNIFKNNK